VAKVAADMVAWMCVHKLHMADERFMALLPASSYRDALARAVAGEPEVTIDQLLLLGDSCLVWAASWSPTTSYGRVGGRRRRISMQLRQSDATQRTRSSTTKPRLLEQGRDAGAHSS
jgi:hypothetical protein